LQPSTAARGAEGMHGPTTYLPEHPSPPTFGQVRHDEHGAVARSRAELHDSIDRVERQPPGLGPVAPHRANATRQESNRSRVGAARERVLSWMGWEG